VRNDAIRADEAADGRIIIAGIVKIEAGSIQNLAGEFSISRYSPGAGAGRAEADCRKRAVLSKFFWSANG